MYFDDSQISRREFIKKSLIFTGLMLIDPPEIFGYGEGKNTFSKNEKNYLLVANIPAYTLSLYEDDMKVKDYIITVGKPTTPTPLGEYKILTKANWDKQYAGTWMRFKSNPGSDGKEQGGWGIHGTLNKEFLGHALSKGCIRMAPEEAKELKEKIPIGTPLKNIYEIFGFDGELLEIRTDIYNLVKDPESKIKEMLLEQRLKQRFLNKVKLEKILEEMETRKKIYIKTCMELYKKYIRPLDDNKPHPDLIKKYPEIKNYLKTMEENKKLVIELKEILA